MFRNAVGNVEIRSGENKLADIVIERRYNREELVSAAAAAVEADLRVAYPNETCFVLLLGNGSRF